MASFMEIVAVIGLGEVGRPLFEILSSYRDYKVYGYDIRADATVHRLEEIPKNVDYLHIAFPYTDKFVNHVLSYVETLKPKRIVIHSTVVPGTTRAVYEKSGVPTAFSPVRGKHPNLKRHMMFWPKWVSAYPLEEIKIFADHLAKAGFKVKVARNPETLELAKIFETVYRALMIAAWHQIHRVATKVGADITEVAEFIAEVHQVLGDRPVYYPDYIGGHCLIPNTELLLKIDPAEIWKFILESNEKRKEELKDEKIRREVEEVKKIAMKLVPAWYFE